MSGPRQPSQREFSWVPPIRWYGSPQPSVREFGTGDHVGFRAHRRHRESSKMSDKRLAAEDFVDESHTRAHRYVGNEVGRVAVVRKFSEEVRESFVRGGPGLAIKGFHRHAQASPVIYRKNLGHCCFVPLASDRPETRFGLLVAFESV